MSSWYSSWFTGLPVFDFAVPSGIQRRFFSFLLKRTLGHFLKPGQLDLHQIDSELGSGTVHVKDLELDGQAINQLLVGLPVTLYDGFISGVTARVPFPNPLSSTVGCHVQSLSLTFQITPEQPISPSTPLHNNSNLADSVVSVAETFIHDELTPREEATLRQTLKPPAGSSALEDESENLPGGFNPFGHVSHAEEAPKEPRGDDDPAGVSIFATLIERLLAKFEFSAVDTKITIIYPEQASFTLSVSEITYRTNSNARPEANSGLQSVPSGDNRSGQIRSISISGLKATSRDLRVVASSPTATNILSPVTFAASGRSSPLYNNPLCNQLSRNSSSSSLDDDTQLMMSQSIAMLPPNSQNSPPSSSASSSLYQSAFSTKHARLSETVVTPWLPTSSQNNVDHLTSARPEPRLSMPCREPVDDIIFSFGSQPIVFSVETPRPTQPSPQILQVGDDRLGKPEYDTPEPETLRLSVNIGTLACAIRSRHLRLLLDIMDACISKIPTSSPVSRKDVSSKVPHAALRLEADMVARAIVFVALPEPATGELLSLNAFYERPLVPPRLPRTYLRIFFDSLTVSSRLPTPPPDELTCSAPLPPTPTDRSMSARLVVSDVSVFAFHAVTSADDLHVAAPILISDHYLPTLPVAEHYRPSLVSRRPQNIELPAFEVIDWTLAKLKNGSAKLSTWRVRNHTLSGKRDKSYTPSRRPGNLPSSPNPFILSPSSEAEDKLLMQPAIEAFGQLGLPSSSSQNSLTLDVKMAPLHLFFDLGMIFKENLVVQFVDDITSSAMFVPKQTTDRRDRDHQQSFDRLSEDDVDVERDVGSHLISRHPMERGEAGKSLVLQDLDLGVDHQQIGTFKSKHSRQQLTFPNEKKTVSSGSDHSFCLTCPMIRIEVRCPPPPGRLPRSGCMLVDLRSLTVSNEPHSSKSSLRFSGAKSLFPGAGENLSDVILNVRLQEILVAYAPCGDNVAHTILILGFLPSRETGPDTSTLLATETTPASLPLSVILGRPNVTKKLERNSSRNLSMPVNIPLVNLVMDKDVFDGLQYWADDVAQLIERCLTAPDDATETLPSRNPSLIGSRYFSHPRRDGTHSTDEGVVGKSSRDAGKIGISIGITEVLLRFMIPRSDGSPRARPFDVSVLDVSALLELKQGKEESVVTVEVTDLRIADTSSGEEYALLLQSPPRSLSSTPRPLLGCKISSFTVPETTAKESQIKLSLWSFTVYPPLDGSFVNDLAVFAKAPPGVFESVIPSERTRLTIGVADVSVHLHTSGHPGAAVLHLDEVEFSTELSGNSESTFNLNISSSHLFLVDSIQDTLELSNGRTHNSPNHGVEFWKHCGYALIAELSRSQIAFRADNTAAPPNISILVERIGLQIHLCADTISALASLIGHMTSSSQDSATTPYVILQLERYGSEIRPSDSSISPERPTSIIGNHERDMTASLDEHAFRLIPEVGNTADMISDDLPANQDYLDASFGTAAGLRELRDDDLQDFEMEEEIGPDTPVMGQLGIVSNIGGETVRILKPLSFNEHYFDTISPDATRDPNDLGDTTLRVRIRNSDIVLFLHDGFDWPRTRKIIEKEVKEMRKRLARIRQLVASGQTSEPIDETTSTTLFNSFHIGLERDLESMDPDALIAAIDDELDGPAETGTEGSWQSLHPASPGRPRVASMRVHGKRLTRSKGPSVEIRLEGLNAEIDNYHPGKTLVSRTLILVRELEILDHIKTSTWKKFLTSMRSDSRGNVRETDSNMARVELLGVRPSPSHPAEEARLRAKILPLRLYVDQDALDFFKKFFAFQDPDSTSTPEAGEKKDEVYFQHAEVFPVDIKLDYKPRRVDYRALRDGRTIELMNFFHFDGAEMTLRHLTLHGITGWPRFFDTLNDLWTPDVKATQLVDVISGVAPIRSVVNVGSGVADLVLLPIAQYKKDGRIVRGLQKGTKAFVQSTAMEAIKLGARLATGTQVILEQAESVLGGQFKDSVTAEALQIPYEDEYAEGLDEDLISRYAAQPTGLKEGVQSAYRSLQRNLHSAAQTILAVPMEVYERSGNEGAVRAVVRAVPIAVLKPMIGASEAVGKTLMGLHNTLDPNIRLENEAKYKHR